MRILLADDDSSLRRVTQFKLQKQGYDVTAVVDGQEALDKLQREPFDLLLADIKMPRVDGIELLERAHLSHPHLKIILITAHATVSQAVQAVKLGAFDYITKPFEDEELLVAIEKALAFEKLERENKQLRGRLRQQKRHGKLLGVSKPFKQLIAFIDKIAATDATVLLTGDSGTGKELVARNIHARSARIEQEFVAVNCAAIPHELIESELFGHVKGAFTGAVRDKKGKFELADGGTLFLDEVGELAIDLQAKLLRVLQERIIEPVGSEKQVDVDVRIIAATNIDMKQKVAERLFREDLYYRLNVLPIRLPSLCERDEDIPLLVNEFTRRFGGATDISVSADLMEALRKHSWPGNIRELENLIERMVILRSSNALDISDLPADFNQSENSDPHGDSTVPGQTGKQVTFHSAQKQMIVEALKRSGGNRTRAAKELDIPRHVLVYRMKKYEIGGKA